MKLELYLRSEVNQKIRPLFLKNKCEHCGCTDDLHLHHKYEFFQIVDNVLNKLQLEMKDTEEYTEYELYLIKSCVLAEHLKDNYLTLCSECHRKEHENNHKKRKHDKKNKKNEEEWQEKRRAKADRIEQEKQRHIELLESVIDKRLTTAEFKALAAELNFRDSQHSRIKSTVKTVCPEIQKLGFTIEESKIRGTIYKRIEKLV